MVKNKMIRRKVKKGGADGVFDGIVHSAAQGAINNVGLFHHSLSDIAEGAKSGIESQTFKRVEDKANRVKSVVSKELGTNIISKNINKGLDSGVKTFKNVESAVLQKGVDTIVGKGKQDINWLQFVALYRCKYPNVSYKDALKQASPLYRKTKQLVAGGVIDSIKDWVFKHLVNFGKKFINQKL